MERVIIDAHAHLWEIQNGHADGCDIRHIGGGRTTFPGGDRQMMPPYMISGRNSAEVFLSNMDYSGVSGAVITQEYIDGNQNSYLLDVRDNWPDRFRVCALAEFRKPGYEETVRSLLKLPFDGLKVPAQRLVDLKTRVYLNSPEMMQVFRMLSESGKFLSIDLADGNIQTGELEEVIQTFPGLRVAIGHFGMVTRPHWEAQIRLARYPGVYIESGGITWLFHKEFYPYSGAVRAIREAADIAGIHKLMWGSDYPRTMTAITYSMSWDFLLRSNELNAEEQAAFLGGNACKFYGFMQPVVPKHIRNMVED